MQPGASPSDMVHFFASIRPCVGLVVDSARLVYILGWVLCLSISLSQSIPWSELASRKALIPPIRLGNQ